MKKMIAFYNRFKIDLNKGKVITNGFKFDTETFVAVLVALLISGALFALFGSWLADQGKKITG